MYTKNKYAIRRGHKTQRNRLSRLKDRKAKGDEKAKPTTVERPRRSKTEEPSVKQGRSSALEESTATTSGNQTLEDGKILKKRLKTKPAAVPKKNMKDNVRKILKKSKLKSRVEARENNLKGKRKRTPKKKVSDEDEDVPEVAKTPTGRSPRKKTADLTFPTLPSIDQDDLPCFGTLLKRDKAQRVGMDDLDNLQLDLEAMLSTTVRRRRILHSETSCGPPAENAVVVKSTPVPSRRLKVGGKKNTRSDEVFIPPPDSSDSSSDEECTSSTLKTKLASNKQSTKKEEDADDKEDNDTITGDISSKPHSSRNTNIPIVPPSVVPVARNDASNKFWTFVEQYFKNITRDDIKYLESLLDVYERYRTEKLYDIPEPGPHYSTLKDQQPDNKNSNSKKESNKKRFAGKVASELKKSDGVAKSSVAAAAASEDDDLNDSDKPISPLVEKLKGAFIEIKPPESGSTETVTDSNEAGPSSTTESNAKEKAEYEKLFLQLPKKHTPYCFERDIRKHLEAMGILDPVNAVGDEEEANKNEVLLELKRCVKELKEVSDQNEGTVKHLLSVAKQQQDRQALKRQLTDINREIADMSMKNAAFKKKKKNLSQTEQDYGWKLLKDREELIRRLYQPVTADPYV